jgi:hypothetical protein
MSSFVDTDMRQEANSSEVSTKSTDFTAQLSTVKLVSSEPDGQWAFDAMNLSGYFFSTCFNTRAALLPANSLTSYFIQPGP